MSPPLPIVMHPIGGVARRVALPITLTPFASARACSARCSFCSETLIHKNATRLSASLRPRPTYFASLAVALRELVGLPIGLSISGLEATDDADWLCQLLDACDDHEANGGVFVDKVLYSNGAGLCRATTGSRLIPRLARFDLDRVELSRHHHDEHKNLAIMRFRPHEPIARQACFEETVADVAPHLAIRLVTIVQKSGVAHADDVLAMVRYAQRLGIDDVVFRELSRIGDAYQRNRTSRYIEDGRVPIEPLERATVDRLGKPEPTARKRGYYYRNTTYDIDGTRVTFETSDYGPMKTKHLSGVVHKLVFHANGNLCADWDPETAVLLRTHDTAA